MQFGDKFLASVIGACALGIGIGVMLVNSFSKVESSSRAADEPPAVEAPAESAAPAPPRAPDLGAHTVDKVLAPDVVSLVALGPVRLLGVDSSGGPDGKPVDPEFGKALLRQIVGDRQVLVTCDPVTADTDFKDENGAYLVYLMLEDGVLVNTELLARGAAVADLDRPYARRDEFVRAERDARFNGRGLWAGGAAKPLEPVAPSKIGPDARRPLPPPAAALPAPQPVPGKNDVLVTKDGRFHRPSCRLSKGGVVMSNQDARAKHYLACPDCFSSPRVKV
jgi:endonuclease YncB( thermonuclease family)